LYSRDGNHAYISGTLGTGNAVAALNAHTFTLEGLVPDFAIGSDASTPYDIDETGMIFGSNLDGAVLLDVSSPGFYSFPTPGTTGFNPSLLSVSAPTPTELNGAEFDASASYEVFFGAAPASPQAVSGTGVSVQSLNILNVTAPPQAIQGVTNVTLTRSDGWFNVMPEAATYEPQALFVQPSASPVAGGSSTILFGYGLDSPNVEVKIGGAAASITGSGPLGISPFPFPTGYLSVAIPPGTPGLADITISSPQGSSTLSKGFQYLASAQIYAVPGALDSIIYDQPRQRLYATNEPLNRVEIFDLASQKYLSPVSVGNQPSALALTPDGTILAVVNSADGTVSSINPATMQVTNTYAALTPADQNPTACGGQALNIAPVTPHNMLIDVYCNALAFSGVVHLLNLDTGSLSCSGVVTCAANGTNLSLGSGLFVMASIPGGSKVLMADVSEIAGAELGYVALLDFGANTVTASEFGGSFDGAVSADGTIFASDFELLNTQMFPFETASDITFLGAATLSDVNLVGEKLNPSGSLLFVPQQSEANGNGSGMDIFDVHRGRLAMRIALPEQLPLTLNSLALDETGTKMFLISNSGITIASLFAVPLSLATVNPASGPAGIQVNLRGSGFQSGATVQFGTASAAAEFVDSQTIQATVPTLSAGPVRVTITNPNGVSYTFDAAFTVN
jgi:hypothetical protein